MNQITFTILCLVFLPVKSQTEWIRGKVKDAQGAFVKGCIVTLKHAAVSDTTDYNGSFNIEYSKPITSVELRRSDRTVDISPAQSESYLLNGRKLKESDFQIFFYKSDRWNATNRIITESVHLTKNLHDKDKNIVSSLVENKPFDTLMVHGKYYKDQQIPITEDSIEIIMEFDNPPGKNVAVAVEPFECLDQKNPLKYLLTVTGEGLLKRDFSAETDSVFWIDIPSGPDRRFSFEFTDKAGNFIGRCDKTRDIADSGICIVEVKHSINVTVDNVFPVHSAGAVSLNGRIESTILPIQFSTTIFDQNHNNVSEDAIRFLRKVPPIDKYKIDFKTDLDLQMEITGKACNGTYLLIIEAKQASCTVQVKQSVVIDGVEDCE